MKRCQFCRQTLVVLPPSGFERVMRPFVSYGNKVYCAPCWDKLRSVAARTGGVL